ncbi:MAG: hypothetical protein RIF41_33750, partial [Polyangiaceae bacterium]
MAVHSPAAPERLELTGSAILPEGATMRRGLLSILCALIAAAACGDDGNTDSTSTGAGGTTAGVGGSGAAGGGEGGGAVCGSANLPLETEGLVELSYDDGMPLASLREQTWQISVSALNTYVLNEENVHEAMRFELEHPATIHAIEVMWANVPDTMDPAA